MKIAGGITAAIVALVALTGYAATAAEPTVEDYVSTVQQEWRGAAPTDDEVLSYGGMGCQALVAGLTVDDFLILEGSADAKWNDALVKREMVTVCDDLYQYAGCFARAVIPAGERACMLPREELPASTRP